MKTTLFLILLFITTIGFSQTYSSSGSYRINGTYGTYHVYSNGSYYRVSGTYDGKYYSQSGYISPSYNYRSYNYRSYNYNNTYTHNNTRSRKSNGQVKDFQPKPIKQDKTGSYNKEEVSKRDTITDELIKTYIKTLTKEEQESIKNELRKNN